MRKECNTLEWGKYRLGMSVVTTVHEGECGGEWVGEWVSGWVSGWGWVWVGVRVSVRVSVWVWGGVGGCEGLPCVGGSYRWYPTCCDSQLTQKTRLRTPSVSDMDVMTIPTSLTNGYQLGERPGAFDGGPHVTCWF